MKLNEYQALARETAVYPKDCAIAYTLLGLCGEAGEAANIFKKVLRDDDGKLTDEKFSKLRDELGDILWYLAMLAHELGISLEDIAKNNLSKLAARKVANTLRGSGDNR